MIRAGKRELDAEYCEVADSVCVRLTDLTISKRSKNPTAESGKSSTSAMSRGSKN